MWCRYKAVNFLPNLHNRHPIARPWGMGCLLWLLTLIYVLYDDPVLHHMVSLGHNESMCLDASEYCVYQTTHDNSWWHTYLTGTWSTKASEILGCTCIPRALCTDAAQTDNTYRFKWQNINIHNLSWTAFFWGNISMHDHLYHYSTLKQWNIVGPIQSLPLLGGVSVHLGDRSSVLIWDRELPKLVFVAFHFHW